jgi:tetratricopeptide (TPR) repeat protein
MAYCESDEPKVVIEDGEVRVLLRRGSVALFVDPGRPIKKKVTVETAMAGVRAKGTLFKVRVDDDDNAWVEVFEGIVEVIPKKEADRAFLVAAGSGAELKQRATFKLSKKLSKPTTDMLIQTLRVKPAGELAEKRAVSMGEQDISSNSYVTEEAGEIGAEDDQVDSVNLIEEETLDSIHDGPEPPVAAPIKRLIDEARACLLFRDWKCAASRYQEVLKVNSRRPGLTTVYINLAKIELRHLNLPRKALAHYKTYLRRAPNGPLAEEAFLGVADSYRSLGRQEREAETLRRFIEKYPKSNLSRKARIRLQQLVKSSTL